MRAVSSHRTTTSPTCKRYWTIGPTRALVCRLCGSFLDSQLEHGETCSAAEATGGHHTCVHAVLRGLKIADQGITTEPRGLTETQSRLADLFTTTAVPGRSAALDVCVASSTAAAARGDTAQAAFDRKHLTQKIWNSRPSGSRHRLSPSGLDSRRSTTPSSHLNPTICSRHCSVLQRSANVS